MSNDTTKWVAETRRSYGVSDLSETDAVYRMAYHWNGDPRDTERLVVWKVEGYHGGAHWKIDADEVLSTQWFEVDGDDFADIIDAVGDLDRAIDSALLDADEVDPRE